MTKEIALNCSMSFDEFIDPNNLTEIVDSITFGKGEWQKRTALTGFPSGVTKNVIPVDMGFYRLSVFTKVEPGTAVKKHKHDEPIFRYIVSGSLVLNGKKYQAGDWLIVPTNYPYEILSVEGYVALAGYGQACQGDGGGDDD